MESAIKTAKERNQKAIRLDVLEGNTIPEKMYASYGFQYIAMVFENSFWKPELTGGLLRDEALKILNSYFADHQKG